MYIHQDKSKYLGFRIFKITKFQSKCKSHEILFLEDTDFESTWPHQRFRRVAQVWFQNARARSKKNMQISNTSPVSVSSKDSSKYQYFIT
jgi:hypothetical protein